MGGFLSSKASQNRAVDPLEMYMKNVIHTFFLDPLRKMIDSKELHEWTTKDMRLFFHHLSVQKSVLGENFLKCLMPEFLLEQKKPFNIYTFIADNGEDVSIYRDEEGKANWESEFNRLVFGVWFLYHTVVELKRSKINHSHLIHVLKFDVFLQVVVRIPLEKYKKLLSEGHLVREKVIHAICQMRLGKDLVGIDNKISIVYVVTDTAVNKWAKFQKSVLVNLSLFKLVEMFKKETQYQYGFFHPAILLNSKYLEWDTGSVAVCQNYVESWSGSYAKVVFHVGDVQLSYEALDSFLSHINKVLDKWNGTRVYSRKNSESEGFGNCHGFFHDIRKCLVNHLPGFKEAPGVFKILESLPKQTDITVENIFSVALSKGFKDLLKAEKELNLLFCKVKDAKVHKVFDLAFWEFDKFFFERFNCHFSDKYLNDYVVLKAFDRGFWMRRKKAECKLEKKPKGKLHRDYKDVLKIQGVDVDYKAISLCPFQDPSKFTLKDEEKE